MIFNFVLSNKQKEQILEGNFTELLNNFVKILEKNEISNVQNIEGPFSNGNKEIYIINYDKKIKE